MYTHEIRKYHLYIYIFLFFVLLCLFPYAFSFFCPSSFPDPDTFEIKPTAMWGPCVESHLWPFVGFPHLDCVTSLSASLYFSQTVVNSLFNRERDVVHLKHTVALTISTCS